MVRQSTIPMYFLNQNVIVCNLLRKRCLTGLQFSFLAIFNEYRSKSSKDVLNRCQRLPSYRNQSIDFQSKLIN